ncbi:gliding motility-associated C-terminal domain-containing protein [Flaviramulus aquimarinus]|uniref:T9SS type B sorting domain-containing protein n=1 Tax=Flaviramulus aquimarinus TaxID=1170456 RepID=UPI0031E53375
MCSFIENGNAQIVIGKPNLGFSQACASPSFNTYNITFTFSPEAAISSTNQFKIELSDATGNFSNATTIYTSGVGTISASPATLSFPVPITISGEAYKLRVKSTAPVATSANSNAFAAYYKIQDTPFSINNLISTGVYCSGGSYLLTIDNPGNESNDSPLQYPALTYNWFKETSPTTSDFIALGETLSVSEPGTYFVETNYGTCTSNSFSNRVTVSESTSGGSSSINSSKGNPFCSSKGPTTLSAINGMSYQWFKDGIEISGATDQMYNTDISGAYSVNIDLGSCTTSAMINLESTGFTSSIDVEAINTIEENETLVATVTTSANNPEYIWYFNDTLIPDAISNRYVISQTGNYKAVIRQTTGCMVSREFVFEVRTPFPDVANIPNVISPNGDGINDTWIIPQDYVNGTNAEIMVLNSKGDVVFQTIDYQNNWPENQIAFAAINPVYYYIITTVNGNVKKGSITVVK